MVSGCEPVGVNREGRVWAASDLHDGVAAPMGGGGSIPSRLVNQQLETTPAAVAMSTKAPNRGRSEGDNSSSGGLDDQTWVAGRHPGVDHGTSTAGSIEARFCHHPTRREPAQWPAGLVAKPNVDDPGGRSLSGRPQTGPSPEMLAVLRSIPWFSGRKAHHCWGEKRSAIAGFDRETSCLGCVLCAASAYRLLLALFCASNTRAH